MCANMTIKKYKEGELVWQRTFADYPLGLSTECAYADRKIRVYKAWSRLMLRLDKLGFFTESGFDPQTDSYWIIVNNGDNYMTFYP